MEPPREAEGQFAASPPFAAPQGSMSPKEAARRAAPRVERRLAERLGPPGAAWRACLVGASRSQGGSLLFEATCDGTGRRVAAKIFALPAKARSEWQAAEALGSGRATLARPLFCDEALGLLVSDWVEGPTLAEALAPRVARPKRAEAVQVILARRGWLALALILLGGWGEVPAGPGTPAPEGPGGRARARLAFHP